MVQICLDCDDSELSWMWWFRSVLIVMVRSVLIVRIQVCLDCDDSDLSWLWWFSSVLIVMIQFSHDCDDSVHSRLWWFSSVMIKIAQFCHYCILFYHDFDDSVLSWLWWFSLSWLRWFSFFVILMIQSCHDWCGLVLSWLLEQSAAIICTVRTVLVPVSVVWEQLYFTVRVYFASVCYDLKTFFSTTIFIFHL